MENNKHYTPDISEFHVGFEFEFQGLDNNWNLTGWEKVTLNIDEDKNFGLYTLKHIQKVLKGNKLTSVENHCRVKYLDKEDIESLGFTTEDNGECYNKSIGWMIIGIYPWEDVNGKPHEYKISVDMNTNFHGLIKNKSELKKILKQLNV